MSALQAGLRRAATIAGLLLGTLAAAVPAYAGDFPERPVRMIVPYAAGGSADVLGRGIAQEMGRFLGQTVIVDLRPGAGGNLGAEMVAKNASPDGYTILFASVSLATSISFSKLDFDPRKDLVPVAGVATLPSVLLVSSKSPIKSVQDLVKASRDGEKNMAFASAGNTTGSHLFGELLKAQGDINIVHVPYRGSGAAYPDLISGRITTMFDVMGSAMGQIKGGQVRPIAITSVKRSGALPDVPSLEELGYHGFDMGTWFGMFAPVGTPPDVLAKLQSAILQAVATPDMAERLRSVLADPIPGPGVEFGKWYLADTERWAKLAREHKIARVE